MGQPAAKQGDRITAMDTHFIMGPAGTPITGTLPFAGVIDGGLSNSVNIMGLPAATVGSTASNVPPHITGMPAPPSNKGTIMAGSLTVNINGKPAARSGDTALTCNDPADLPIGQVAGSGSVSIG